MQELRFVAVSEDGSYAVLAVPGRSGRYILPIDERLRAVALGQTTRLAQYEIEVESPLRPKEIQARIRAGETAEEIADAAGIPVERVRWFEGPVLAERAYIADQAQAGSVRRAGDSAGPGPRLGEIVTERLSAAGTDPGDGQWDSRKRGDGNWQVSLTFPSGGRLHVAEWVFDPRRRHVMPDDDNAARLSLPESELPAEPLPVPGEATVTPIASRLGAAAGMGGGGVGGTFPGASRFRPEKSVIPDRSLGADRSLVERPAAVPDRGASGLPDRAAAATAAAPASPGSSAPAAPRPGSHDRPSRSAHPGYAEFPESAPYHAPEPQPDHSPPPRGYDDPAAVAGALRSSAAEPPAYRDYPEPEPEPATSGYRTATEPLASYADPEPRAYREPVGFRSPAAQPPAPVVFEDPEPAYPDEQPGPAAGLPPAPVAQAVAVTVAASVVTPEPATATPDPAAPDPAVSPAAPAAEPVAGPVAEPVAAKVAEPVPATPDLAAADPSASDLAAVSPAATAEVPAPAQPAAAGESTPRRPGGKKNAKGRRASVPSWDEIMLGSSRQRE